MWSPAFGHHPVVGNPVADAFVFSQKTLPWFVVTCIFWMFSIFIVFREPKPPSPPQGLLRLGAYLDWVTFAWICTECVCQDTRFRLYAWIHLPGHFQDTIHQSDSSWFIMTTIHDPSWWIIMVHHDESACFLILDLDASWCTMTMRYDASSWCFMMIHHDGSRTRDDSSLRITVLPWKDFPRGCRALFEQKASAISSTHLFTVPKAFSEPRPSTTELQQPSCHNKSLLSAHPQVRIYSTSMFVFLHRWRARQ